MKQNKPAGNNQCSKSTRHKKAITSSLRVSRASGVQNGLWKKTRVAQTCWNSDMITVIKAKTRNKNLRPKKKRQKKDPLSPPYHTKMPGRPCDLPLLTVSRAQIEWRTSTERQGTGTSRREKRNRHNITYGVLLYYNISSTISTASCQTVTMPSFGSRQHVQDPPDPLLPIVFPVFCPFQINAQISCSCPLSSRKQRVCKEWGGGGDFYFL